MDGCSQDDGFQSRMKLDARSSLYPRNAEPGNFASIPSTYGATSILARCYKQVTGVPFPLKQIFRLTGSSLGPILRFLSHISPPGAGTVCRARVAGGRSRMVCRD
jgi:hypothetical protein